MGKIYCSKCGSEVAGRFCARCGTPLPINTDTPGYGSSTPGYGSSTPGYGSSTPGYGSSTPGYGYGAPQPPVRRGSLRVPTAVMLFINLTLVLIFSLVLAGAQGVELTRTLGYSFGGAGNVILYIILYVGLAAYGVYGTLGKGRSMHALFAYIGMFVMFVIALIITGSSYSSLQRASLFSSLSSIEAAAKLYIGSVSFIISFGIGGVFWLIGLIFSIVDTCRRN